MSKQTINLNRGNVNTFRMTYNYARRLGRKSFVFENNEVTIAEAKQLIDTYETENAGRVH
jgi:hypothetical protein